MRAAEEERDELNPDHDTDEEEDEEEPEVSLTQLINTNTEMIQGLKKQLAKAKKRMMEGPLAIGGLGFVRKP